MNEQETTKSAEEIPESFGVFEKKAERISSVLYTITDFFDDREELKWKLRNRSVTLLSFMRTLGGENRDPAGFPTLAETVGLMREIRILLSLAEEISLVSNMNNAVISREVRMLEDKLRAYVRYRGLASSIPIPSRESIKDTKGGGIKDIYESSVKDKKHRAKDSRKSQNNPVPKIEKTERRESIKRFLRASGPANIKDIQKVISSASEKTVQRELAALVDEGSVRKTGKRRWTQYALAGGGS